MVTARLHGHCWRRLMSARQSCGVVWAVCQCGAAWPMRCRVLELYSEQVPCVDCCSGINHGFHVSFRVVQTTVDVECARIPLHNNYRPEMNIFKLIT